MAKPKKNIKKDAPIKLNMTFEEAMKKALSTPIKKSKANTTDKETKKAKK